MNLDEDFYIGKYIVDDLLDFELIREGIYRLRVKLKYYNLILISTSVPTEESDEVAKEEFYRSLEKVCDAVPNKT